MGRRTAVIIVNYNGGDYLLRCLTSLYSANQLPAQVIVVDNASSDNSLAVSQSAFPQVVFLAQKNNVGFAAGNNIGIAAAMDTTWIALINPDAFVEPEWLDQLSDHLEQDKDSAFLSCQLLDDVEPSVLDGAGDCYHVSGLIWRRLHGSLVDSQSELPFFAPCAAAALYRRSAFLAVNGFDERYFCYSEDVDLGFRLRLAGYSGAHVPTAKVRHIGSGITGKESDFSIYHGHRNLVWTYFKNMPTKLLWRYLPQHLIMNLVSVAYYLSKGRLAIVRAKWHALKGLPEIVASRQKGTNERSSDSAANRIKPYLATGWLTPYSGRGK